MIEINNYKESFEFFKEYALKTNEYVLKLNNKKVPNNMNTLRHEGLLIEEKILDSINNFPPRAISVVKPEAISRFSPDNIDNKQFWILAKKYFRNLSVSGIPARTYNEVNKNTTNMSRSLGLLDFLSNNIKSTDKMLEIGFGYGNIFNLFNDKCEYYGIDYTKPRFLKKYPNLVEIDKSGIPESLYKKDYYDFAYSVNVLQHCSQNDRLEYFHGVSECLKSGGYFIFSEFLMTKENMNLPCWGVVDEKGRGYTHFFNQLTECDTSYEFEHIIELLRFEPIKIGIYFDNCLSAIIRKK